MAFPLEQTCFKNLQWFDKSETRRSNAISGRIENEAWTKGFPNQNEKNFEEYISTFEWIETWKKHHGKKILKKITPFFIFIFIITLIFIRRQKKVEFKFLNKNDIIFWILIFLNIFGSILWFIKFPVFRYGYGYLIGSFAIIYALIFSKFFEFNFQNLRKIMNIVFIVCFIGLLGKHSLKTYKNYDVLLS